MTDKDDSQTMSSEERRLLEMLRRLDLGIPTTVEGVEALEKELGLGGVDLPEQLKQPPDPERRPDLAEANARPELDTQVLQALARAAREGKPIPPEIEERMRRDKERAEAAGDEEED